MQRQDQMSGKSVFPQKIIAENLSNLFAKSTVMSDSVKFKAFQTEVFCLLYQSTIEPYYIIV